MPLGVLFALVCYSLYSCGDAISKSFAGHLNVFEIAFFGNLFALVPAIAATRPDESWRTAFKLANPWLLHLRGVVALISTGCVTYAFVSIPLAEAYSIVFLTPLFLTLLAVLVLHEKVLLSRWLLVGVSFVGVLIVVRPGFRELQLGQITALIAAFAGGASTTILRLVSGKEKRLSIVAMNALYQVGGNGLLMLTGFVPLTPFDLAKLATSGLLGGIAQLLVISALRRSPASQVGPTQYIQIVWAVIFGAIFFAEVPDRIGFFGLIVVVVSGIATIFADGARARIAGRWSEFRARREGPKFTEVEGPEL